MNNLKSILDSFSGWSIGYQFALLKNKEDEVKQGKNYYLTAPAQSGQVNLVCNLADKILTTVFSPTKLRLVGRINIGITSFLALPFALFCAAVKHDHYEQIANVINNNVPYYLQAFNQLLTDYSKGYLKLPKSSLDTVQILPNSLSERSIKIFSFFAERTGDIARVCCLVSSISLIALGSPYYGSAILVAAGYEAIDNKGYVPRKVSLFMETYMPLLTNIGVLLTASPVGMVFQAIYLSTYFIPDISKSIQNKVDLFFREFINFAPFASKMGYSLEEIEAPLIENKHLSFHEINKILNNDYDYEINPAHFSKWAVKAEDLPKNYQFNEFISLFEGIDWTKHYATIKKKLQNDERFIDFLKSKYPTENEESLKKNIDFYLRDEADGNITTEQFAANWIKKQLVECVSVLNGTKRAKGSQQDAAEAIENMAIILNHAKSLPPNCIELQDLLIKISIEAGDYCARGIKRASVELLSGIQQNLRATENIDPIKNYEIRLRQILQDQRSQLCQNNYSELMQALNIPDIIKNDIHAYDVYRLLFVLGFYPLTEYERNRFDLGMLITWEMQGYKRLRNSMYQNYDIESAFKMDEIGEYHFYNYIQQVINNNKNLSKTEKETIISKYVELDNGWSYKQKKAKFHRLAFVQLGIMRERKFTYEAESKKAESKKKGIKFI